MSVATRNPFSILEAEDASRPSSPAPATSKAAPTAPSAPSRGSQKRSGPASRAGNYYSRGGPGKSAPRDNTNANNQVAAEDPVADKQRKFEGRGRGRGRGAPRGGGGRRTFDRPDRHSATGRTDSDKKFHQGWGGDEGNTELKQEEAATADAAADLNPASPPAEPAEGAAPGEDKTESRPRREREPEEEDTTLTLDQYLAQKKEKEANLPKIEGIRRANEGADDNIWKDAVPLTKSEEEQAFYVGKTKTAPKTRSEKKEKIFIEIEGRFDRPDRGSRGRGRGGRGGGRGDGRGMGRGGRPPRENGNPSANVDVDDEAAFPSLS